MGGGGWSYAGYRLYEELLQDDRVYAAFAQRRAAVVARETEVVPGGTMRRDRMAAEFVEELLEPLLRRAGWWGRQVVVSPDGGAEVVQLGSPHHLRTIYRTNMRTVRSGGRYRRQAESADDRPYWMYDAVMDATTRPSHAAFDGKVFAWDDPIWDTDYPPNGYNCRCRVRALTARQVEARGGWQSRSRHPDCAR